MEKNGIKALNLTSDIDEVEVMKKFKKYMISTLDVSLRILLPHANCHCLAFVNFRTF